MYGSDKGMGTTSLFQVRRVDGKAPIGRFQMYLHYGVAVSGMELLPLTR